MHLPQISIRQALPPALVGHACSIRSCCGCWSAVLDAGQLQSLAYCAYQVMLAVSPGAVRALPYTDAYVKHAFVGVLLLLAE